MRTVYTIILCLSSVTLFAQQYNTMQSLEQIAHKYSDAKILFYGRLSINDGYADISKFRLLKYKNKESYICYKSNGICEYNNISSYNRMAQSDVRCIIREMEDGDYFIIIVDNSIPSINNPLIAHINGSYYYIPPSNDFLTLFQTKILLNEVKMASIANDVNNYLNNGITKRNIKIHFGRHITDTISLNDNIIAAIQDYHINQYGISGQLQLLKVKTMKYYYRVDFQEYLNEKVYKKRYLLDKYDLWINDWHK